MIAPATEETRIAASDVAAAPALVECEQQAEQRHDHDAAADAEDRPEEACDKADRKQLQHVSYSTPVDPLTLLATEPERAALLLDVDGVLAPIVPRPEDSSVPPATRRELERLAGRYALVACITGRTSDVARAIVGVDGLRYAGAARTGARAERRLVGRQRARVRARVALAVAGVEAALTVAYHYRRAPDESAALAELEPVAAAALAAGLRTRWGRMVLEVLPPVDATKGTAVRHLLDEQRAEARALRRRRHHRSRRLRRARRAGGRRAGRGGLGGGPVGARRARRPRSSARPTRSSSCLRQL